MQPKMDMHAKKTCSIEKSRNANSLKGEIYQGL